MHQPPRTPLRERLDFAPTDSLLREDVRRLGALVGTMLGEQVSPDFLQRVEAVRRAAIDRREQGLAVDALADTLHAVPLAEAEALVRAFAAYFNAVNLAERVHRIRRRRDYQKTGDVPQPGGLAAVCRELRAEGVTFEEVQTLLARMRVEPVLTAHPTEAMRRALLTKEQDIVRRLVADIDRTRTPSEQALDSRRILQGLATAWQTSEAPPVRPTVADEMAHVGFYLGEVLYRVLPAFHRDAAEAVEAAWGRRPKLAPILRFGTWVGGDMDGNPNVGAATVRDTLAAQRVQVLGLYQRDLRTLAMVLTQTVDRVPVAEAVHARIAAYRQLLPQAALRLRERDADMPYRQLLQLMRARLAATAEGEAGGYPGADDLLQDLDAIDASLKAARGEHAGRQALWRVRLRVASFGFHLAALDLRQDSAVHDAALAALLDASDWMQRPIEQRIERLHRVIDVGTVPCPQAPAAAATLAVFDAVRESRARYGAHAFGPYIVSMSRTAADALAVLALARVAGCVEDGAVPLDVAPLFETVDDLAAAPAVVAALFADPLYRRHLAARGGRQQVMLGYSDSAKDGGLLASRWALQQTQLALTALAREAGIAIEFFHGRGGSISRGGGKTSRAVIAAPRGSVDGVLRLTEQGEVIHRKYGIRALALRNLEQMAAAVLRASLRPRPPEPREQPWREAMVGLAAHSRTHYRALVHEHPQFPDYFRAATPVDVIERLQLGSRPSRRRDGGIANLRAIPWVFAWAQNRSNLTAWYGVGSALEAGIAHHGLAFMTEMARDWPFFAAAIDDIEMVLAKTDMDIFERYSRLAGDLHAHFHDAIAAEFARTRDAVLAIKGRDALLGEDYRLRLSIRLRNPYVDPISLLQVDLLQRWRAGDRHDEELLRALVATVNGIAAGIQNTG